MSGASTSAYPEHMERFLRFALFAAAVGMACSAGLVAILGATSGAGGTNAFGTASIAVFSAVAAALGLARRRRLGAGVLIYGNHVMVALSMVFVAGGLELRASAFTSFALLGAFLISPVHALVVGATGIVAYSAGVLASDSGASDVASRCTLMTFHLSIVTLMAYFLARKFGVTVAELGARVAFHGALFAKLPAAAGELGAASGQLAEMTRQHGQGAVRQSAAVQETREVLRSITDASAEIVNATENTSRNADQTLANGEAVADHVARLAGHNQRIAELLAAIQGVANKSDLLALNAALEGARAGEVGRGFQLVAAEMQRLAENVASSARDIEAITHGIRHDTASTQGAMQEMMSLARATTDEVRHINLVVAQQRSSMEQVMMAMSDIAEISAQVASGSEEATRSTAELRGLAERLAILVDEFSNR